PAAAQRRSSMGNTCRRQRRARSSIDAVDARRDGHAFPRKEQGQPARVAIHAALDPPAANAPNFRTGVPKNMVHAIAKSFAAAKRFVTRKVVPEFVMKSLLPPAPGSTVAPRADGSLTIAITPRATSALTTITPPSVRSRMTYSPLAAVAMSAFAFAATAAKDFPN